MQDLIAKLDRAREICGPVLQVSGDTRTAAQKDKDGAELLLIGFDLMGEVIVNSRRIADALEAMAASTGPKMDVRAEAPPFQSLSQKS